MTACQMCHHESETDFEPQIIQIGGTPIWSYTTEKWGKKSWSSYSPPPTYKAITACSHCGIIMEVALPEGFVPPVEDEAQEVIEPIIIEPGYNFSEPDENEPHPEADRWEQEGEQQPFPSWTYWVARRYRVWIPRRKNV